MDPWTHTAIEEELLKYVNDNCHDCTLTPAGVVRRITGDSFDRYLAIFNGLMAINRIQFNGIGYVTQR